MGFSLNRPPFNTHISEIYRYVIWLLTNLNARGSSGSHVQEAGPRNSSIIFAEFQRGNQDGRVENASIGIPTLLRDLRTMSLGRSAVDANVNEHRTNGNPITGEGNAELIRETRFNEEENRVMVSSLLVGFSKLTRIIRVKRRQLLFAFENLISIRM